MNKYLVLLSVVALCVLCANAQKEPPITQMPLPYSFTYDGETYPMSKYYFSELIAHPTKTNQLYAYLVSLHLESSFLLSVTVDGNQVSVGNVASVGKGVGYAPFQTGFVHLATNSYIEVAERIFAFDLDTLAVKCNISFPVPKFNLPNFNYYIVGDDVYFVVAKSETSSLMFSFSPSSCTIQLTNYGITNGPASSYGYVNKPVAVGDGSTYLAQLRFNNGNGEVRILATIDTSTGGDFKMLSHTLVNTTQDMWYGVSPANAGQFFMVENLAIGSTPNIVIRTGEYSDFTFSGRTLATTLFGGRYQIINDGPVFGVGNFLAVITQTSNQYGFSYFNLFGMPSPGVSPYTAFPIYASLPLNPYPDGVQGTNFFIPTYCGKISPTGFASNPNPNPGAGSKIYPSASKTDPSGGHKNGKVGSPDLTGLCVAKIDTTIPYSSSTLSSGSLTSTGFDSDGSGSDSDATTGKRVTDYVY